MLAMLNPQRQTSGAAAKLGEIKKTIGALKAAKNPAELVRSMVMQNPAYKNALEYVQANGGDPKAAFEQLAREQGLDPGEIAKLI